jgi:hypothetical protein
MGLTKIGLVACASGVMAFHQEDNAHDTSFLECKKKKASSKPAPVRNTAPPATQTPVTSNPETGNPTGDRAQRGQCVLPQDTRKQEASVSAEPSNQEKEASPEDGSPESSAAAAFMCPNGDLSKKQLNEQNKQFHPEHTFTNVEFLPRTLESEKSGDKHRLAEAHQIWGACCDATCAEWWELQINGQCQDTKTPAKDPNGKNTDSTYSRGWVGCAAYVSNPWEYNIKASSSSFIQATPAPAPSATPSPPKPSATPSKSGHWLCKDNFVLDPNADPSKKLGLGDARKKCCVPVKMGCRVNPEASDAEDNSKCQQSLCVGWGTSQDMCDNQAHAQQPHMVFHKKNGDAGTKCCQWGEML